MKLKNKISVITGAGKGIGRATAQLFLDEGSKLVLVSRTASDLEKFVSENPDKKSNIITITGDISKQEIINETIKKTFDTFGGVDILINNAGFGIFSNLVDSKTEDFDAMFSTNVRALYLLTKGFLPQMFKQKEGTIINIASIAGKNGVPGGAIYSATKHAVMGLSRSLLLEVRKHGVRVIAICPGSVDTHFFDNVESTLSSDKMLSPEDVAECCLISASVPHNATINEIELRPSNP